MTWEETIKYIRNQAIFKDLVEKAYFEEDLPLNVERFMSDEEFETTLTLINQFARGAKKILDVGSGNGISAVAFALNGFEVVSSEPDPSETIGAGAIRKLKTHYRLSNLEVFEEFAEKMSLESELFDIVYVRQAMHHAHDLDLFIKNLSRLIKRGGFLFTVRDHVIYDERDKQWFLESHPLQKYYGGENAFTYKEYISSMKKAGLKIVKVMRHFDNVINYFPAKMFEIETLKAQIERKQEENLVKKIGFAGKLPWVKTLYKKRLGYRYTELDEAKVPGRMYSFIAQKG